MLESVSCGVDPTVRSFCWSCPLSKKRKKVSESFSKKVKKELELRELEKGDLEKRFKAIDKELEYFYCNMDIFDSIIINIRK